MPFKPLSFNTMRSRWGSQIPHKGIALDAPSGAPAARDPGIDLRDDTDPGD